MNARTTGIWDKISSCVAFQNMSSYIQLGVLELDW